MEEITALENIEVTAELFAAENPGTGEWLSTTGFVVAGVLVALCVVFAIISSVRKKKHGGGKKKQ